MPLCRILNKAGQELVTFNTDDFKHVGSISIGRSALCAVPLNGMQGVDESVGEVHLALVKQDNVWSVVKSHMDLTLKRNEREIVDAELNSRDVYTFGCCRLVIVAEKTLSRFALAIELDKKTVDFYPLCNGENLIGTSPECDICINNDSLSAIHAAIKVDEDSLLIEDKKSEKGVYVLGNRIGEKTFIELEEILFLGALKVCVTDTIGKDAYNPFVQGGVQRQKKHWQLVNLGFFAIIFILLCLIIWKDQKYGQTEKKRLRVNKKQKTYLELNSPELQQKIWKNVESGNARLALNLLRDVRVTEANKKDYQELKDALIKEKNAITDLKYYTNKMAFYNFKNIGPSFQKLLLKRQQMDEDVLQASNFWREVIQYLQRVEARIPKAKDRISKRVGEKSYFLKKLPEAKEQLENLIAFYQLLEKINILWDEQNWIVLGQMIRDPETVQIIKRNKMNVFCNKIGAVCLFGTDLDKAMNHYKYMKLTDLDLNKEAAKVKRFKERLKVMQSNSLTPVALFTSKLDEYEKQVDEAKKALALFDKWQEAPDNIDITRDLSVALRNLKWRQEPIPLFDELHGKISKKMNQYVVKTVEAFNPTLDRKGIEQIDRMIQYSYLINDSLEDERYLKLRKQRDTLIKRIDRQCDELYSRYNTADENDQHDKLMQYLKEILELAPKDSRYHTWAKRKLEQVEKGKGKGKSNL